MQNLAIKICVILLFFTGSLGGQSIEFEHTIKVKFEDVPLVQVLETMTKMYDYQFSYIPEKMPLQNRVFWNPKDAPNNQNIENFLQEQKIQFIRIGDQYVLKYQETEETLVDVYNDAEEFKAASDFEKELKEPREKLFFPELANTPINDRLLPYTYDPSLPIKKDFSLPRVDDSSKRPFEMMEKEGAQISLIPGVGTSKANKEKVNKASLNLLYGYNGGVEGIEVGAGVNRIEHDVNGVQVAGIANHVGNKVTGFQWASTYNRAKSLNGVQLSGTINVVTDTLEGMQISGFGNIHRGKVGGFQFASFFNTSRGAANSQISGFYNQAESIDGLQGGIINAASHVEGIQFGLINVADSVSGASIGLLSFVKHGYNHFEIYSTEAMYVNGSFTFGSRKFYNRIILGATSYDQKFTWGLGYGIGTNVRFSEKNSLNIDLQTMHVNVDGWSKHVNFLNTLSFNLTTKVSDRIDFFIGPTANLYIKDQSNLYGSEPVTSPFLPDVFPFYSEYKDDPTNNTLIKGWVGWKAGFRI